MDTVIKTSAVPLPRSLGLSWPLLVAMLAIVAVLGLDPAARVLGDPDSYWHVASGRWIVEHASIPSRDPFSYSLQGAPWTAHEWLSEIAMYGIYRAGGWAGLVVMAACCFALVLARLTRFLMDRMEPAHALLFVGFTAGMLNSHLLARPHVMAWLLLAAWTSKLIDAVESRRAPPGWLLALMVLWANMHLSFTLGLLLAGALALEALLAGPVAERRRMAWVWGRFLLLAIAASVLTPHGWESYAYTWDVMQQKVAMANIGEWLSPNFQQPHPLEVWVLLMLGIALTGRAQMGWLRVLLILGLVHLALKHQRNVDVLGLVTPFLLATPLARSWQATSKGGDVEALDRWFRSFAAPARPLAVAVCTVAIALFVVGAAQWRDDKPAASITPKAAMEAAMAAGARGRVLNDYGFGGYLIQQGIPVFIDGRSDMYGDRFLEEWLAAMRLKDRKSFLDFLEAHRFGWSLLPPGTPAIAVLDDLPGWRRIYADETAVVHVREAEGDRR
ncbi:MAG TPA: hypothetical protein VFV25_10055 [Methylibium sp.]